MKFDHLIIIEAVYWDIISAGIICHPLKLSIATVTKQYTHLLICYH